MRMSGKRPSTLNPHLCNGCEIAAAERPGGAELEISMLFADVRGSTTLAEQMDTASFSKLIRRFYSTAVDVLVDSNALIDKLVGDQVTGYYLPAFVGENHESVAIEAAHTLLRRTGVGDRAGPWIPIGVGVHTGIAYIGAASSKSGISDITALGDNVNIAARLASNAGPGELLVSEVTFLAAGLAQANVEQREIELKGRTAPVQVRVLHG
jgi:adenylate cyclase